MAAESCYMSAWNNQKRRGKHTSQSRPIYQSDLQVELSLLESVAGYYEAYLVLDVCQLLLRQELLGGDVLVPRLLAGSVDVLFDFFDVVEACGVGVYVCFYFRCGAEDNACKC